MIGCVHCAGILVDSRIWPRPCLSCGELNYNSPKPVVAVLVRALGRSGLSPGLLVVLRGIQPHKDTWAFPGGFLDHSEDWALAAARETHEETGVLFQAEDMRLLDVVTTPTNYLVMFVSTPVIPVGETTWEDHDLPETLNDKGEQEVLDINLIFDRRVLGIPSHNTFLQNLNMNFLNRG